MADGNIDIELELEDSKAVSKGKKAGSDIAKGVESGLKNIGKAADSAEKSIEKPLQSAAKSAKSSFSDVGSAAKSSFSNVGDAAKTASDDASSAFKSIPADAEGSFADVSSEAQSGFSGVADAAQSASGDAAGAFDTVADAAQDAGNEASEAFGVKTVAAGNIAADAIEAAASKLVDFAQEAIDAGTQFDKSMSQVAATMGKTTDEIGDLTEFAKEMGANTAFSASQASEALNYMALAGYDAETSMKMLPTVLNLAAAGNFDLAAASDMVTDAQSALGLSLDETSEMVDKMAKASSKSNTSVEQLGNAFLTVGGTAKNLKGGTTELASVLGVLADNGIKGSEGGTALRNVILSLSAPTDTAAKKIEELGLSVFDAEGNMRALPDIMADLNSSMDSLNQGEKTQVLNAIFNKVDLKSVNALLGTSSERFDELSVAIGNAGGAAAQMAETQLDNLAGDMTLLDSATEGLYIAISDKLSPVLRSVTQFATNTIMPALMGIVKNFGAISPSIVATIASIAVLKGRTAVMTALASKTGIAATAAKTLGLNFATMTARQKVAAVATNALRGALSSLGKAMPVIAVTALVSVITMAATEMKKAKEHEEKLESSTKGLERAASGLTVKINEETGAFESLEDAVSEIDLDELIEQHAELAKAMSETNQSAANSQGMLSQYSDAIQELAGRSDLSEEEVAKLKLAVDAVNEACGTSYEVVQDNAGAYQVMADGAVVAKDSVYDLIEAQKAQIRAQAEAENYKAVYEQMAKDQDALTEATKRNADAEEALKAKLQELGDARYGVNQATGETIDFAAQEQAAYDATKKALDDVRAQAGSTQSSLNKLEEQQILTAMASEDGASALIKAADANMQFKSAVQGMDIDLVAFTRALQDMGFTSEQVANLSTEDAMKLANGWKSGYDSMKSATEEVTGSLPDALANMGEAAYNNAYGTGTSTGQGFVDGVSSKQDESEAAGEANAEAAADGMGSEDSTPQGAQLVRKFAVAVGNNTSQTERSAQQQAKAAKQGMQSEDGNAKTWGNHLGDLFASGIRAAQNAVSSAGEFLAGIVKNILGHTVAKEGPLHEGGKGEYVWGLHLVQNIASGMTSSKAKSELRAASKEVAVELSDSLKAEMMGIEPMAQLQASITQGNSALNMSSMMVGAAPSYTTNNQNLAFYGEYQSPDIIAREMRMQQHYGLAGQWL